MWTINDEINFFTNSLKLYSPEKLFYKLGEKYLSYVPNKIPGEGQTLQSRNSFIGNYTETWLKDQLLPIVKRLGYYALNNVVCEEIGLPKKSDADVAICRTDSTVQSPDNIKLIIETKMSIVNNYEYIETTNSINFIGDFTTHSGNPSLLRSDSMLKAIGKAINIRVSGINAAKIPIVIIGNSPITGHYVNKVDYLKKAGVIQAFLSLYSKPTTKNHIEDSPQKGFQTISDITKLKTFISNILVKEFNFFSSMKEKEELGRIISISSKEPDHKLIADKFLKLLWKN